MICDRIGNRHRVTLCPAFEKAFAFLENCTGDTPDGTYELDGRNVYAMVQSYATGGKEKGFFEAHRKYIDIQYTISGSERIAWRQLKTCKPEIRTPYSPEKDVEFSTTADTDAVAYLDMQPGVFAVLFPQDGHWGGFEAGSGKVKKVCIKILADLLPDSAE